MSGATWKVLNNGGGTLILSNSNLTALSGGGASFGKVAANRDGRGHKNLHTAAFYFTDFTGTLNVYGSLNNSIDGDLGNWVLINSTVYTEQTGIDYTNLEGAFNYFKFEYVKTSGTIDKVLYRS